MANDTLIGNLKLTGLPELACIKDINDLVAWIIDHTVVDFPGGITQGVVVGPIQPTDPAVTGIWIKTDSAGTFLGIFVFSGGSWIQVDLGGCLLDPAVEGTVLVCADGIGTPLVAGNYGDVLTLTDSLNGKATYLRADDNKVSGSTGLVSIGAGPISLNVIVGPLSLTSSIVDVVITNNHTTRAKTAGLCSVGTAAGYWNIAVNPLVAVIDLALWYAFDGGGYTRLHHARSGIAYPEITTGYYDDMQVSVARPILTTLAPGASTTLHLKLIATISGPGATAEYVIQGMYISALVTELTTL
jgi:hypothetical protein